MHDQQRSRLPASLVPANRLAGLQGNHKPLGQVHALGTAEGFRHRLHRLLAHQHVTLRREVWPGDVSEPRHALRTRPGGAIPLAIHESDLSNIPARILGHQPFQCGLGALPLGQEAKSVDAQIGVDPGLGRHRANAGFRERTEAAHARHSGRDRHAEHPGARAARRNRKGTQSQHLPHPPHHVMSSHLARVGR